MSDIHDVVVVGFGAAGCAAAIEASRRGASVLILEKANRNLAGGNTRVSGGIWFQSSSPDRAAVYLNNLCGGFSVDHDLVEAWAHETHLNTSWLRSLGIACSPHTGMFEHAEYPELDGSDCYQAGMGVEGVLGEEKLWRSLVGVVEQQGIAVRYETGVSGLLKDESGCISGVEVRTNDRPEFVHAGKGVVLACGGFENNPAMVRDYLGIESGVVWGSPLNAGDGIRAGLNAGADLWHMTNRFTTTGVKVPGFEAGFAITFPDWGWIWVGRDGRRFVDETLLSRHGHVLLDGSFQYRPTTPMHVVCDELTMSAGPIGPTRQKMAVGWNLLVENYEWSFDNSREVFAGWIKRADSTVELATILGVDDETLSTTIDEYNRVCRQGVDEKHCRPAHTLRQLSPPFYTFPNAPVIGWANGGLRRDGSTQVLDQLGNPIPHLFAAGTVSSTYPWCKDAGFHIADAIAFGRVAGRTAAQS